MVTSIRDLLHRRGPMRGSKLVGLMREEGLSSEAARQRLSRARLPIRKFPLNLLPKSEGFYYLDDQRNRDAFWENFIRDMREAGSTYALAIDGLRARGDVVAYDQFPVISGAPAKPMKKQLNAEHVRDTLIKASFIEEYYNGEKRYLGFKGGRLYNIPRPTAELVLLDAVREWARKLGFASFNTIAIRGDEALRPIGPFMFDLAGPSWFSPVQAANGNPGFLVADVFAEGTLNEHHIAYFIRKVTMLRSMRPNYRLLPFLIADSFTGTALTTGHKAGISLATPTTLFGRRAGAAIISLVETMKNVAAYAAAQSPERIERLIVDLADIEGRALNLRGVLFELICGYLARRDAVSIDMGVTAVHPETGRKVDIDVLKFTNMTSSITCIECKGREPSGQVDEEDVRAWLAKAAVMRAWLANHANFREAEHHFELWTSGTFTEDALALLRAEQARRIKAPISWKDGDAVLALATAAKEKAMVDAFHQHFMSHPFANVAFDLRTSNELKPVSTSDVFKHAGPGAFGSLLLHGSKPDLEDQF